MILQAVSINYIVVDSEHDALILENSLIKQLKPKYNILLRDDKTYPYIYIDYTQEYPRFDITRKIIKGKEIKYFGPYSTGARDILDSIYQTHKLVQKKSCLKGKKACLYYQIEQCLAPCEFDVARADYLEIVKSAIDKINNKKSLVKDLEKTMHLYAESMRFEEAGEIRDRIERIQKSQNFSYIDILSNENFDIFAISKNDQRAVILRLFMRNGKIISSSYDFINLNNGIDIEESYERAIIEFYKNEKPPIISEILIAHDFSAKKLVVSHLSELFEKKAKISFPLRGNKKKLIDLALLNTQELLKNRKESSEEHILRELQDLCQLSVTPYRIETFDNSHMAASATVGAMVVYEKEQFVKSSRRVYHLEAKDEYGQMREVLVRRIESFDKNPPPDLWVLDGGTTLLKLALDILESFGINLDVVAISKEKIDAKSKRAKGSAKDILHTSFESFKLDTKDKRLQLMQRVRDEAHKNAINFHKKTKLKNDQESNLLRIKGISSAKIAKLLKYFGTFENIKNASLREVSTILNERDAKIIKNEY